MAKAGEPGIDPVEKIIWDALDSASIEYSTERDPRNHQLDLYIVPWDVHVEVKQFHTDRIAEQMSRVPNVIAIQGTKAAQVFADLIQRTR